MKRPILFLSALAAASQAGATPPIMTPPPPPPPPTGELGQYPPATPPLPPAYDEGPAGLVFTPLPQSFQQPNPPPPNGDPLGDVWEMEEVASWSAVWLRRGKSRLFDAYWTHPNGERVRASLEMWVRGYEVVVVRRHEDGQYCRYDGVITPDWVRVEGRYTCTWERTPMHWRAQIVRMEKVLPRVFREQARTRTR